MRSKPTIFENRKYYSLTPIKEIGRDKFGCVIYTFQCDCGKVGEHVAYRVKNGQIRSCGCSRKNQRVKDSILISIFRDYKLGAKNRNYEFNLSLEEFIELVSSNCYYCNAEPRLRNRRGLVKANGVDRKDNLKGYIQNNVVPCCTLCNKCKGTMSSQNFLDLVSKININQIKMEK